MRVFNIERFATHDGDGIRTVVFLKGCPLRCPWCSNPESREPARQLFHTAGKCLGCGSCQKVCPAGAVRYEGGRVHFRVEICTECGACADICPGEALEFVGRQMEAEEIVREVLRDRDYYEESGGGVTLSGGEPFAQAGELVRLLLLLKQQGLNTAVETAGQYPTERLEEALPYVDTWLYDVKHIEEEKLRTVVGGDWGQIEKNLRFLAGRDSSRIVIRVPVIPGFDDCAETLERIIGLAAGLGIRRVDLLPYHTLGREKYDKLSMDYSLKGIPMMDRKSLYPLGAVGRKLGVEVTVGGRKTD